MKNESGFSMIVLVVTIVILLILTGITFNASGDAIDDAAKSKETAEATMDDDKIKEIMTYELAGTKELIDIEIDLKRVELDETLKVKYEDKEYGIGYCLYISDKDIEKVEEATTIEGWKSYKEITRSYVVDYTTGKYIRLQEDWEFVK